MIMNVDYKRVGVMRFLKVGRLSVSWSVAKEYRPIGSAEKARKVRVSRRAITSAYWHGWEDAQR